MNLIKTKSDDNFQIEKDKVILFAKRLMLLSCVFSGAVGGMVAVVISHALIANLLPEVLNHKYYLFGAILTVGFLLTFAVTYYIRKRNFSYRVGYLLAREYLREIAMQAPNLPSRDLQLKAYVLDGIPFKSLHDVDKSIVAKYVIKKSIDVGDVFSSRDIRKLDNLSSKSDIADVLNNSQLKLNLI